MSFIFYFPGTINQNYLVNWQMRVITMPTLPNILWYRIKHRSQRQTWQQICGVFHQHCSISFTQWLNRDVFIAASGDAAAPFTSRLDCYTRKCVPLGLCKEIVKESISRHNADYKVGLHIFLKGFGDTFSSIRRQSSKWPTRSREISQHSINHRCTHVAVYRWSRINPMLAASGWFWYTTGILPPIYGML